ncbi:MFS transporter [Nonomuraea dietziae]|uniref:MFS transporter n=1 Tax=Nonomuraea dietziae TaxID=65515 RepID=UPI0031D438B3
MTVRIPALTDKLGLSEATVGVILLVWGLGALVTMQSMRGIMQRAGSRTVLRVGGPATALSLLGIGCAPNLPSLLVAVAVFGMAFGTVDIAMNAQGSTVEQAYGRPLMNGMHAGWCVGAIAAGGIGSLAIALGLSYTANLSLVALISLPLVMIIGRTYLPEPPVVRTTAKARKRLPAVVYLLGAIMFFAFMVEGTVADWNGLFMRDELGAPEAIAALGYPVFEVGMLLARLGGDRLRGRFGVRGIMTVSGVATARDVRDRADRRHSADRGLRDVLRRARRRHHLADDAVAGGHRHRQPRPRDRPGGRDGLRGSAARPRGDRPDQRLHLTAHGPRHRGRARRAHRRRGTVPAPPRDDHDHPRPRRGAHPRRSRRLTRRPLGSRPHA